MKKTAHGHQRGHADRRTVRRRFLKAAIRTLLQNERSSDRLFLALVRQEPHHESYAPKHWPKWRRTVEILMPTGSWAHRSHVRTPPRPPVILCSAILT